MTTGLATYADLAGLEPGQSLEILVSTDHADPARRWTRKPVTVSRLADLDGLPCNRFTGPDLDSGAVRSEAGDVNPGQAALSRT